MTTVAEEITGNGPGAVFTATVPAGGARPDDRDEARLAPAALAWEHPRWPAFVERTDLHEARRLEIHQGGELAAVATLLVTHGPHGLLFYDPPRLVGTAGSMAMPDALDAADRDRWQALTEKLPESRAAAYPSLTLGTFGSHHGVRHAAGRDARQRRALMAALPALVQQAARELGCRSHASLYLPESDAAAMAPTAARLGHTPVLLGAEGVRTHPGDSFDDYVERIGSRRRVKLRRELKDYAAAGFRTVVRTGADAIGEDVVDLQVRHRAKYGLPGGAERVRREFAALQEEMGDACVLLGAEQDGRLGGFVLFLRTGDVLCARTAGFLPETRGCYPALTYHETARWAVEHGIGRVHYGLAAYQAKFARGCELRPRWGWFSFGGDRVYRDLMALQTRSLERHLAAVGAPVAPLTTPGLRDEARTDHRNAGGRP